MDAGPFVFDPGAGLRPPVNAWVARRLAESTAARDVLAGIEDRCFAIVLEGTGLTVALEATGDGLKWVPAGKRTPDATLTARPLDALALARVRSLSELTRTEARLDGQIGVAEQFARLLTLLAPEPEAELADWVGDIAAHEIVTALRASADLVRTAIFALEQDTAEFLRDEQELLAAPDEVREFSEAVEDLRDAVERAVSRVAALERSGRGLSKPVR